jgi:predicted nucleic acid-binding protein
MTMLLILDSTFVIDHLKGDREAGERWHRMFENGDQPVVTEVVVCEVRAGLRARDEPILERMLIPTEFVQPSRETALLAGRWRADVRATGRTLGLPDSLIAAAAFQLGGVVVTRNVRDFGLTPVRIETY